MKKRRNKSGQLVCQHLENISSTALEDYQKIIREFVRGRHGIYALYKKGKLYYVGLASNLRSRLKHHLRDRHKKLWDRFSVYLIIQDDNLKELETLVLRIASPKGNKQAGKFTQSEDLRQKFKQGIVKYQKAELTGLFSEINNLNVEQVIIKRKKGRQSTLAPYVNERLKIRCWYKGKRYIARVRANGIIYYDGKLFTSPSLAGKAVVKHAVSGWGLWYYERSPGEWVKLSNLKR